MEYTVQNLSKLAGVSTRTLRYYDEIGILKPARINSSGYRIYGEEEIDILQQILFYKELGINLDAIKSILENPSFNKLNSLKDHHEKLLEKRKQLDLLIKNVEQTIASVKGDVKMDNKEKFKGFKQKIIDDNEKKYGKEIRNKYGNDTIDKSNKLFANMSEEDYNKFNSLSEEINKTLLEAFKTNDPSSNLAQKVANMHREWLLYTWPKYSKEAHAGLAQMYVDDERFKAYYDKEQDGLAEFLRDSILIFTGINK
ncbi:MerR family transcriptional regulator [Clostridium sardiniense]|uniref:MerR family transcriptional regulator n=1 Tax=Clostridium sardiniense TaxID=29369 RepID=A0ABS7L1H0_CLOSR|nr:MerR family transcriptional regulator [Clostridium sardiniense]MBY0756901.1 MerR family transcriptional regulator [Clostridium sardiniense]MDQ0458746.1 DNA-binding transcriptional MerR regulator [Clostridium sardiniense]